MNEFGENRWSPDQCALDAQILADFQNLEAVFAAAPDEGAFLDQSKDVVQRITAALAGLEHQGRVEHWHSELARLGALPASPEPAPDAIPTTIPTPTVELNAESTEAAPEPVEPAPIRPRNGGRR